MKKLFRRLIRRLVVWALASEPVTLTNWDINTGKNRFDATDIFVRGGSTSEGRKVVVNAIKTAKTNREL